MKIEGLGILLCKDNKFGGTNTMKQCCRDRLVMWTHEDSYWVQRLEVDFTNVSLMGPHPGYLDVKDL